MFDVYTRRSAGAVVAARGRFLQTAAMLIGAFALQSVSWAAVPRTTYCAM